MLRYIVAFAAIFIVTAAPAFAARCENDSIKSVSSDGKILVMLSGALYQVDAGDTLNSKLWLPTEDVIICDEDSIINKDQLGEKVGATRLR